MKITSLLTLLGVAVGSCAMPVLALAADEINISSGLSASGAPLALHGYDPVAYFTGGAPAIGEDTVNSIHNGVTYRVSSQEHKRMFDKNPARYVPQYGGFCAYGVSVGKKFDGDPRIWTVRNDRLYLNLNSDIAALFNKDVPAAVSKADQLWTKIEHKAVSDL